MPRHYASIDNGPLAIHRRWWSLPSNGSDSGVVCTVHSRHKCLNRIMHEITMATTTATHIGDMYIIQYFTHINYSTSTRFVRTVVCMHRACIRWMANQTKQAKRSDVYFCIFCCLCKFLILLRRDTKIVLTLSLSRRRRHRHSRCQEQTINSHTHTHTQSALAVLRVRASYVHRINIWFHKIVLSIPASQSSVLILWWCDAVVDAVLVCIKRLILQQNAPVLYMVCIARWWQRSKTNNKRG